MENALFDDLETVRDYAKEKGIPKVMIIGGENDNSTEVL